jgi:hypothetical protein
VGVSPAMVRRLLPPPERGDERGPSPLVHGSMVERAAGRQDPRRPDFAEVERGLTVCFGPAGRVAGVLAFALPSRRTRVNSGIRPFFLVMRCAPGAYAPLDGKPSGGSWRG